MKMMMAHGICHGGCGHAGLVRSCLSNTEGKSPSRFRSLQLQENQPTAVMTKRCLRCGTLYTHRDNSPTACSFHGHTTGEKGLYALAPPHQGIDGEWSDRSGVIVYRWNDERNRPNTGRANWKRRWSCCAEYGEDAPALSTWMARLL